MAEHSNSVSDVIRLSGGESRSVRELAAALLPSALDFGKMPRSPLEKVTVELAGALRDIASRTGRAS
jgi:hypothetical protein